MRAKRSASPYLGLLLALTAAGSLAAADVKSTRPEVAEGWRIELVARPPMIVYPTAVVCGPDGTVYLGQDPMDMPGPPTQPIDSVVALKDGKVRVFADKLWAVMGLEWADDTLYVVHAPYLSAFRDTDGDGKADSRVDLMTGLGPKLPGFNGINDHVASGIRLGMDGFLYIAVGDKGIPKGVAKDGTTIQLHGGGVIRIRPDGSGLEVVSTGERNPLSVALSATDEVFTYGNDDDSKKWPNSLTHHTFGAHFGYPYQFVDAPERTLPIMAGQIGGSGTQGICYNEDGLPDSYRGNLFFCDWGLQTVFRYVIEKKGGTFSVKSRAPLVSRGDVNDFRPFSLTVSRDGASLYLVDWGFNGWLANGPNTGRLWRMWYEGPDKVTPSPRPTENDPTTRLKALDHPALTVRLESQRALEQLGAAEIGPLVKRLGEASPETGRLHALWALDTLGTPEARKAIRGLLADGSTEVRLQAARSSGIRRDREALTELQRLLDDKDAAVRREAAIAVGKIGDRSAAPSLMASLGDPDAFVAWSVRKAIRSLDAWNAEALVAALLDPKRRDDASRLCDETWAAPVVEALAIAFPKTESVELRARLVATLAGNYRKYPAWSGNWFGTNPLAGQFPQKTEPWDAKAMAAAQAGLTVAATDPSPEVRLQAIAGLFLVGRPALPTLRSALSTETDPKNLAAVAQGLGVLGDFPSAPKLGAIVQDAGKTEAVRLAALDALGKLRGPQALTARISLVYDPKAPDSLVARALPSLGREGIIPPNDLTGFLEHKSPVVRSAALLALSAKKAVPDEVAQAVLARLDDSNSEVRLAAVEAVAALKLREATPRLIASAMKEATRAESTIALARMPDPQAVPVYLAALRDRSPEVRKAGESALLAIRDAVSADLVKAVKSGQYDGPASLALERVLTRFKPLTDWKVVGPFPRTTAQVFIGDASIDFTRTHTGAEGKTITWAARQADPATGRVVLDDYKAGTGDRGGFGYDTNGSPDLCAFGYSEIESDRDRDALLLVGSSGTLTVTVNEQIVHRFRDFAGRVYRPDSDLVRVPLKKGKNRLLAVSRQGIGSWSFGVQVSEPSPLVFASKKSPGIETLRAFALTHAGDPKSGEALFFDAKGIGCVKCHAATGKGTANLGPDLTGLALKYDKAELIASVLEPSKRLAIGYQSVLLATHDGKVVTGLVKSESDTHVEIVDAETKVTRVAKTDIEDRKVADVSLMPTGLADSLSVVEFADLISYLQSLKSAPATAGR